jgi:hypothetical protein
VEGPIDLPPVRVLPDGRAVSGFNRLTDAELASLGWLPVVRPSLQPWQSYGTPVVTATEVTFPLVDDADALDAFQQSTARRAAEQVNIDNLPLEID